MPSNRLAGARVDSSAKNPSKSAIQNRIRQQIKAAQSDNSREAAIEETGRAANGREHAHASATSRRQHANVSRGIPLSKAIYQKTSVLVALVTAEIIWIILYLVNAFSTAWGSQPPIWFSISGINRIISLVDTSAAIGITPVLTWTIGFMWAIGSTAVEVHLWRVGQRSLFYTVGVVVIWWDLMTASMVMKIFFHGSLGGGSLWQNLWYTVFGSGIALIPEPMLVITTATLYQVIKGRREPRWT